MEKYSFFRGLFLFKHPFLNLQSWFYTTVISHSIGASAILACYVCKPTPALSNACVQTKGRFWGGGASIYIYIHYRYCLAYVYIYTYDFLHKIVACHRSFTNPYVFHPNFSAACLAKSPRIITSWDAQGFSGNDLMLYKAQHHQLPWK